ncbi:MAG: hypothetical protein WBD19_08185, partial [Candidatus Acidiferrum sp.]
MTKCIQFLRRHFANGATLFFLTVGLCAVPASAQQKPTASLDPAEPLQGRPHPKILPRPTGAITRANINEKTMRTIIHEQVSCGT